MLHYTANEGNEWKTKQNMPGNVYVYTQKHIFQHQLIVVMQKINFIDKQIKMDM